MSKLFDENGTYPKFQIPKDGDDPFERFWNEEMKKKTTTTTDAEIDANVVGILSARLLKDVRSFAQSCPLVCSKLSVRFRSMRLTSRK